MFCKMLPIDGPTGDEAPVTEYHFSRLEEKLAEEEGPYKCDVYSLVQHLYGVWLQRRVVKLETPTWKRKYRGTCHDNVLSGNSRRHVSIDGGKPFCTINCRFHRWC